MTTRATLFLPGSDETSAGGQRYFELGTPLPLRAAVTGGAHAK
jgi:hypothetical protein